MKEYVYDSRGCKQTHAHMHAHTHVHMHSGCTDVHGYDIQYHCAYWHCTRTYGGLSQDFVDSNGSQTVQESEKLEKEKDGLDKERRQISALKEETQETRSAAMQKHQSLSKHFHHFVCTGGTQESSKTDERG